ncbi:MAG: SPOR domain-containing protein [Bacteroidetes bacterium]|nr:SPOR domain-containing protein [Bacteroidota bacterium]MBS1979914.1 SPOR domain-containing protein [Bacteroidota bacterium]
MKAEKKDQNTKSKFITCLILTSLFSIPVLLFAQKNKPYHEDLSKWRPKVEVAAETKSHDSIEIAKPNVVPTQMINAKVDAVLDSIDQFNRLNKFIDGYTIQIYSGQKRGEAMDLKKKLQEEIPDLTGNLLYQQPKFRVTVGKYFTKVEAQPDLLRLKRKFTAAIIVPEKIQIR